MAGVVEQTIPGTFIKRDLFGFIDIVALMDKRVVGIQATSASNVSARIKKIKEECFAKAHDWLVCGGRIQVWGWGRQKVKRGGKAYVYVLRVVQITEVDLLAEDSVSV
jgi:hypothetical protein